MTLPSTRATWRRLHRAASEVASNRWGEIAARVGLAARGVVYLLLGYLVVQMAVVGLRSPASSKAVSGQGVAQTIAAQPGGRVGVSVLAVALLLYAGFSALDAILHHDTEVPTVKRWGDRALSAWGVVVYGAFSGYCFATALSARGGQQSASRSERQDRQWSARVLRWPAGWLWLGGLGLLLVVISFFLVTRCVRRSFRPRLRRERMRTWVWRLAMVLGVIGYLGRAELFAIVGWFVLDAAITDSPSKGQGVDGSVRLLANGPAGPFVLGGLAAGLAAYGWYVLIESRHRSV